MLFRPEQKLRPFHLPLDALSVAMSSQTNAGSVFAGRAVVEHAFGRSLVLPRVGDAAERQARVLAQRGFVSGSRKCRVHCRRTFYCSHISQRLVDGHAYLAPNSIL
jgi:hypothetical protein